MDGGLYPLSSGFTFSTNHLSMVIHKKNIFKTKRKSNYSCDVYATSTEHNKLLECSLAIHPKSLQACSFSSILTIRQNKLVPLVYKTLFSITRWEVLQGSGSLISLDELQISVWSSNIGHKLHVYRTTVLISS